MTVVGVDLARPGSERTHIVRPYIGKDGLAYYVIYCGPRQSATIRDTWVAAMARAALAGRPLDRRRVKREIRKAVLADRRAWRQAPKVRWSQPDDPASFAPRECSA